MSVDALRRLALVVTLAALAAAGPVSATPFGARIEGGVSTRDRVWLWTAPGALASTAPGRGLEVRYEEGVLDAAAAPDGALAVLRRSGPPADAPLVVTRLRGARADDGPPLRLGAGERPLALLLVDRSAYVLTSTALHELTSAGWRSRRLHDMRVAGSLRFGRLVHAAVGRSVVLGWNRGEWGGALERLDLDTATLSEIAETAPVTGLAADPGRSGCLQVSLGITHFLSSGEVDRLCGASLTKVFSHDQPGEGVFASSRQTEPEFGLAKAADGRVWVVSPRGLRRTDRAETLIPLPIATEVDGVRLSFAVPGLVIVWTDANAALSLSGETPLVFAAPAG